MNTVIIRPRSSGIQKKSDCGAGCGVNMGAFYPHLGCLWLVKQLSLLFFFLKIRTDFVPMNESDVKVKGPGPYSIARLKPRFMVDALSIEILISKKV